MALNELIKKAPSLDLKVFLLKYTAITDALIAKNVMTSFQRVNRLLEGLSEELQRKVVKFCVRHSWKISLMDTDDSTLKDPDYNEIQDYLMSEATANERLLFFHRERASNMPEVPESMGTPGTLDSTADDPSIAKFKNQLDSLVSLLKTTYSQSTDNTTTGTIPDMTQPRSITTTQTRVRRCIWCDSTVHSYRSECPEFAKTMKTGNIRLNERNRVVLSKTNTEISPAFGKGSMKRLYEFYYPKTKANHKSRPEKR